MAARLGDVLYWAAFLIAVLAIGGAVYVWNYGVPPNNAFGGWVLLIFGAVTWLVGRGFDTCWPAGEKQSAINPCASAKEMVAKR
jgi:hypothetical protein